MKLQNDRHFAILIDADNVSNKYIKFILNEISNEGVITYKRIYGDWTSEVMVSWKPMLLEHSVTPIQQYSYTSGKNATDSAMIIDAMDILYAGQVDGFCIVSSDSDFTRLAVRLREAGKTVVGMGERKTPKPFIVSCNKFKYLEVLAGESAVFDSNSLGHPVTYIESKASLKTIISALQAIIDESTVDGTEWAYLSHVGSVLSKRYPDFDTRNYGFKAFTPFIMSLDIFEVKVNMSRDGNVKLVQVKNKVDIDSDHDIIDSGM